MGVPSAPPARRHRAAPRRHPPRLSATGPRALERMTDHPVNGLDDVVHQRVRLGILAITHEARKVEFGFLRTTLELTAGNLSQHLTVLENAGLIVIEKGYEGRRGRTWVQLTKAGRHALRVEIAALKALIGQLERG